MCFLFPAIICCFTIGGEKEKHAEALFPISHSAERLRLLSGPVQRAALRALGDRLPAGGIILCVRDFRVHSEAIVISNQGCCAGLTSDIFDYQIIKRQGEVITVLEYVTLCVLLTSQWSPYEFGYFF